MCSSRRGETKLLYHTGWGKLKGDASIWSVSPFGSMQDAQLPMHLPLQWNARRATSTRIANTSKRETRILGAHLALGPRTKISGPHCLSPHLANFWPRALSHSAVTLETAVLPPPPAVLDPIPGACLHLVPDPRARRCLDPGLRAWRCRPLPQALRHYRAAAVDLDSTSLRARRCHWPRLCLPWSVLPPSTSTPPPFEHITIVVPDLLRYEALTYLWLFV
jgi:hypothetical protein